MSINNLNQTPTPNIVTDESNDPKSGENDSPEAITGAVEAGWNGSMAGTNDALGPDDSQSEDKSVK